MKISDEIKMGAEQLNNGEYPAAIERFKKLLEMEKNNYDILNFLAVAHSMSKEYETAVELLHKAINIDDSSPKAHLNLAIILFQKGDREESLQFYNLAIQRDRNNSNIYFNYAVALSELYKYDEAKFNYEKAISLNNNNYPAHYNLGLLNLLQGNFKEGWKGYEFRSKAGVVKQRIMPGKKWAGENIPNSTLYVYPDQGFGDSIQFVRFMPEIKKKVGKLILECQPSLFPVFKKNAAYDEIVETKESLDPGSKYDYYLPITSLGKILNIGKTGKLWTEPYIFADKNDDNNYKRHFEEFTEKKIGLVWRSNSNYKLDEKRAIPLEELEKIFSIPNCKYFSLQMNPSGEEIELFNKYGIINLSNNINNFEDTVQFISHLDLIISTDTAVPHLAGAMGKTTFLLLTSYPDWRWRLECIDSFWYSSVKLFRQKMNAAWETVVDEIYSSVKDYRKKEIEDNSSGNIFFNKGMDRLKNFLLTIKEDTYPETPSDIHTLISDNMISQLMDKIEIPNEAKILDVGCGQGLALNKFEEYGYKPVGITLNSIDYGICKKKGFDVYQMDQSFLDFEDDKFDMIWARHVLEHSIFPFYTLHEYKRVLKKNGLVYIEIPAANFDAVHERNPNHYSVLTKTMWGSLFERVGYKIIYDLDFDLELENGGKDQYWMFVLKNNLEKK